MFKRLRLSPPHPIVNASLAASVIFLSACGGEKTENENNPPEAPVSSALPEHAGKPTLQAVWATQPLMAPITSLAFVGGAEPILAASLSTGALQLFDLQGDRITAPVNLDIKTLATGQAVVLDGAAITLFPGISQTGDLKLYAYSRALDTPLPLNLIEGVNATGLCAGPPLDDVSIMQLAYWSANNPSELVHGHVRQDTEGNLLWAPLSTSQSAKGPITACLANARLEVATANTAINLAELSKYGRQVLIAQTQEGNLNVISSEGKTRPIAVQDGISVRTPSTPTAMAALSEAKFGNYPNGLLVLGGLVNGAPQITLIEPINIY